MERTFKYALFDLDGTLCDTEGQYTVFWGRIGREYKPEIPNFAHVIKGTTLVQIFANHFPDPSLQETIRPQLYKFESEMDYTFFPGVKEFIRDIKAHGVKCAIVTSSNRAKMENVYRNMPDFNELFDRVFTAEDFTASKPAPDCYLYAASQFSADISECVVFEDALTGLQAGMSAGIHTVGVASGLSVEQIKDHCNHVITGFKGLGYKDICDCL